MSLNASTRGVAARQRNILTRRPLVFASVIAVVAIVAAGYGSATSNASSSKLSASPTKAQFAKQMNSLCVRQTASVKAVGASRMQTMSQVASIGPKLLAVDHGFIILLDKLQPPAALKPHLSRFVSVVNQAFGLLKTAVAAAQSHNATAFQKAAAAAGYQTQSEQAAIGYEAKAIGAPACASAY